MDWLVGALSLSLCGAAVAVGHALDVRKRRADAAAPQAYCHQCRRLVPATTLARVRGRCNEPAWLCLVCDPFMAA